MKFKGLFTILLLAATTLASGQILRPISWKNVISNDQPAVGEEVDLIFNATIDDTWYLYSSDFDPDLGPMLTVFEFEENDTYELVREIQPIDAKEKYDSLWEGNIRYFRGKGRFVQTVKILKADFSITGTYSYQVCTDVDGKCIPFEDDIAFGQSKKKEVTSDDVTDQAAGTSNSDRSLWSILIGAFLAGLVALLTPCVYPMIPITVSIFLKQSKTKKEGIKKALVFGSAIIILFSLIGFLVSLIWGFTALNELSTHWLFNIIIFSVFILFALAFFGMFEMTLPSGIVNKIDKQADKGGWFGIMFMAVTLVVVSFSCTFPIVGSALISVLSGGSILEGTLAMFGFSLAFAIPFTGFAIFPAWLKTLPKSGGWLNSVKVVLGFLELALALKFLSVADLAYHWGILDREVYLALWIAIFTTLGLYLLGKIRFSGDSEMPHLPVPRMLMAVATFSFVVYLIPGMWGAPLKSLAGFLPPLTTHDFNLKANPSFTGNSETSTNVCDAPKYQDFLHWPHGLQGYFDFEQAMDCAKAQNKPVFIDFTGHGCVNCREMEQRVWADPQVLERLNKEFVLVALYVDDKTKLPESEWYTSEYDGKVKNTIGKQNADLQIRRWNNNAQPFYVILNPEGELLLQPKAYDLSVANFVKYLDTALENHRNQ